MEEISKKELLQLTGISYGQLYRWKRKGLIPEEWFVKRASYTGQETFFPKDQILERIDKILELKDEVSLEELSKILNDEERSPEITIEDLKEKNLFLNQDVLEFYTNDSLQFNDIILLKIIDNIYQLVSDEGEIKSFYDFLNQHAYEIVHDSKVIYVMTKDEKLTSILVKESDNLEYQLSDYLKINLKSLVENIKLIISL